MNKLVKIKDFNLTATMECGQCFNFRSVGENEYIITAFSCVAHVKQNKDKLEFFDDVSYRKEDLLSLEEEIEKVWLPYFDLERDYAAIRKGIVDCDPKMKEVVANNSGIRLLNQDFYEMVISFIISQRQNIPQIKNIIRNLSVAYGKEIGEYDGVKYYSFPDIDALSELKEEDFAACKTGYRASYLVAASKWLKELDYDMKDLDYAGARKELLTVKGIGEKVADCILLFGLKKTESFPVDVWIARVMNELYGNQMRKKYGLKDEKLVANDKIRAFGEEKFGVLSGYAQQFLFDYGRNGKNK
ncbi:MAG: N-glycosylase [Parasporobacterium sp.]|nr:N-glycosylase [Parasporobacterium sp.]